MRDGESAAMVFTVTTMTMDIAACLYSLHLLELSGQGSNLACRYIAILMVGALAVHKRQFPPAWFVTRLDIVDVQVGSLA